MYVFRFCKIYRLQAVFIRVITEIIVFINIHISFQFLKKLLYTALISSFNFLPNCVWNNCSNWVLLCKGKKVPDMFIYTKQVQCCFLVESSLSNMIFQYVVRLISHVILHFWIYFLGYRSSMLTRVSVKWCLSEELLIEVELIASTCDSTSLSPLCQVVAVEHPL